jgi:hypothetical protein
MATVGDTQLTPRTGFYGLKATGLVRDGTLLNVAAFNRGFQLADEGMVVRAVLGVRAVGRPAWHSSD